MEVEKAVQEEVAKAIATTSVMFLQYLSLRVFVLGDKVRLHSFRGFISQSQLYDLACTTRSRRNSLPFPFFVQLLHTKRTEQYARAIFSTIRHL